MAPRELGSGRGQRLTPPVVGKAAAYKLISSWVLEASVPNISVWLGDREYRALMELAERTGRQRGQLIREAVRALLEREGALRK